MSYQFDLLAQMEKFEQDSRNKTATAHVATFKNAADTAIAHQAVAAALRAADLAGILDTDGLRQALKVIRGVRDAYYFLGDSNTISSVLTAAVLEAQEHATRALEAAA